MKFELKFGGIHQMWHTQLEGLNKEQVAKVEGIIGSNYVDSLAYKLRTDCGAFLQGNEDGWILIEFWHPDSALCRPFMDYLNARVFDDQPSAVIVKKLYKPSDPGMLDEACMLGVKAKELGASVWSVGAGGSLEHLVEITVGMTDAYNLGWFAGYCAAQGWSDKR